MCASAEPPSDRVLPVVSFREWPESLVCWRAPSFSPALLSKQEKSPLPWLGLVVGLRRELDLGDIVPASNLDDQYTCPEMSVPAEAA